LRDEPLPGDTGEWRWVGGVRHGRGRPLGLGKRMRFHAVGPVGTAEIGHQRFNRPDGTQDGIAGVPALPAIHRWAIVERPSGPNCQWRASGDDRGVIRVDLAPGEDTGGGGGTGDLIATDVSRRFPRVYSRGAKWGYLGEWG
jgi:hypothetical protein